MVGLGASKNVMMKKPKVPTNHYTELSQVNSWDNSVSTIPTLRALHMKHYILELVLKYMLQAMN
jgi:hypothetical protein